MRTHLRSSFFVALVLAPLARANELTHTATVPLAISPWSQTVTIPRFPASLGTLDDVRVELRNVVRGRVGYENTAASAATSVISLQGTLALTGAGNNFATIAALPVAAQTQAFDGVIDFAGPSGGLVANLVTQATNQSTPTESLYIGSGTVSLTLNATNTTNIASGAPLQLNPRVQVDAEVRVTYVYTPPRDCDNDGTPDTAEPDSDGDGLPNDCDQEQANYSRQGSLLVYPEIDSRPGFSTIITLTTTHPGPAPLNVRFVYIDTAGCFEFNRTRSLTPNDTFSAVASSDSSATTRGYMYAYAVDAGGQAIASNTLSGTSVILDGATTYAYGIDALAFSSRRSGTTDADNDGLRDLNGIEYDRAPDELVFPRFFGTSATRNSDLILLNLSGGGAFTAVVSLLLFNDNEEVFSGQTSFVCWTKNTLSGITPAFSNAFLQITNHNPNEILGATTQEAGWFRLEGLTSASSNITIPDPAILAVLVERQGVGTYAVEMPFYVGEQANGDLVITSPNGDTSGN